MSDPFDTILATPSAAPKQSADPFDTILSDKQPSVQSASTMQMPKAAPMSPERSALDALGGIGETIANAALGTAGALGGGLAESAGLVTGSTDRAQRWHDWAQRNISTVAGLYDPTPQTETGKGIQEAANAAMNALIEKPGEAAGEKTLETTGSPLAATIANTATKAGIQTALAAVTGRVAGTFGRGISGETSAVESPMDTGRRTQPVIASSEMVATPAERQVLGGGAAVSSSNPYPKLTGQIDDARAGDFPLLKSSGISGDVSLPEQSVRSSIAGEILGQPTNRLRPGVVTGNEDTLRTESALAKASNPTPAGLILRDKMAEEQRALGSYSSSLIDRTGAAPTLLNNEMRGDLANSTLYGPESLRSFISDQKQAIYQEAAQRQGNNPVALPSLENALSNPQLASSLKIKGLGNFLPGVSELVDQFKTNGFENPVTGEQIPPNTIAAAQELKKALNASWSPDNSMFIGRLKGMIDNDVAQAGGADLYAKANALHAAEQRIFEAPGMKKIFGDVDPATGISKGLSSEKIIPAINNLPIDQYRHVYNVFDSMSNGQVLGAEGIQVPPELQIAAQQVKNELAGSLVRDVYQAGSDKIGAWNANSANKVMNAYTQKLGLAATPDVLEGLHTLNLGGQIMPNMHSYEGAAQQARRMDQAGLLERNLPSVGAVIGGALPIPGASWMGGKAGEFGQQKLALRRQMKQAQELDTAMEAAAKLGKK